MKEGRQDIDTTREFTPALRGPKVPSRFWEASRTRLPGKTLERWLAGRVEAIDDFGFGTVTAVAVFAVPFALFVLVADGRRFTTDLLFQDDDMCRLKRFGMAAEALRIDASEPISPTAVMRYNLVCHFHDLCLLKVFQRVRLPHYLTIATRLQIFALALMRAAGAIDWIGLGATRVAEVLHFERMTLSIIKQEKLLALPVLMAAVVAFAEHDILTLGQGAALVVAAAIIGTILLASIRVAHHAEILAVKVGDPYGTMILTLSAVAVEVLILAIMMSDEGSPTLVRDTIYSAVMLDINGILGLAALLGGLKFGEQPYNDDSGKTYGVMILTAMGISMIVPEFVPATKWQYYSAYTIVAMIALYALFLKMQVGTHSYFFSYSDPDVRHKKRSPEAADAQNAAEEAENESAAVSIGVILFGVVLIGILAEFMSTFLSTGLEGTGAPVAVTAILVAGISAGPEILTALRAALANRMQATVNIAMGASLSTVILTVPVMEAIALYTGQPFVMAMTPVQTVMVTVTLIAAAINLNDGETNAIEGMTHFILFATFIMLSALGL